MIMKSRFKHFGGSYNIILTKNTKAHMAIGIPCLVYLCDGALLLVHAQWVVFNLFASLGFSDKKSIHCKIWFKW